ncbi:MAG: hypothetical protein LW698_05470 [Planctomycetaceae bacterium]|nr:hypothetical protein [Planctomycetaceae bacterium]
MSSATIPAATVTPASGPLRHLLADVRRRARTWIWIESLAWLALLAGGGFWASLAFDWCVEPPPWVRAALLVATAACLLWVLVGRLVVRLAVPLRDDALAVIVERSHPEFRDGLSTAISLAGRRREDVDPTLLARTTAAAEALVSRVDRRRIFRHRSLSLLAVAAVAAVATIAGFVALRPAVAGVWVRRSLLLRDEPWPRRTALEVEGFVDGVRKVARGADVDVIVQARGADGPPAAVDLRMRSPTGWKTARMGTRGGVDGQSQTFGHVIEAVGEDLRLEVRGGDARLRNLRLLVVAPPATEAIEIRGVPPEYLGGPTRTPPVSRLVSLPRGSRVAIDCRATKPLAAGRITVRPVGTVPGVDTVLVGEGPAGPSGTLVAGLVDVLDRDLVVTLELVDTDGLTNREPITFTLLAVPDEQPRVAARLRGISTAVTPHARLPLEGTISDDHALAAAEVRLAVQPPAAAPAGPAVPESAGRTVAISKVRGGLPLVELSADDPPVEVEPLGLVPGMRLAVTVAASDACTLDGGPQIGTSDTWTLDVVTPEAMQAMLEAREIVLRRRYEAAIEDFAQGRERLTRDGTADAAARFGEAVARATGETAEIAAAFRDIRLEFANNALLTAELETRLITQIAAPLTAIATADLPGLATACRATPAVAVEPLGRRADEVLARMRAVLARMMELESFNELIERLRGVIRTQEEIRAETLRRQKQRAREALE